MGRHRLNYSLSYDVRRGAVDERNRPIAATPEMLLADDYSSMVGQRIRRLRQGRGWTQARTVQLVKHPRGGRYSTGLLSRMERGWANPPLYVYIHVAQALGTAPSELLGPEPGDGAPTESELTLLAALREAGIAPERAIAELLGSEGLASRGRAAER